MSKYKTDSLFGEMDSGLRGNDKGSGKDTDGAGGHVIRVAFDSGADGEFDYVVSDKLWPIEAGRRVKVPFGRGNKPVTGFCVSSDVAADEAFSGRRLKKVLAVVDSSPLVNGELLELARWISGYYVCPLGQVLGAMVPGAVKKGAGVRRQRLVYLAGAEAEAIAEVRSKKQKQIVEFLREEKAIDADSAVEVQRVLEEAGSTAGPLKRLGEKLIVKIVQKEILKSLPVLPDVLAGKVEQFELNGDQVKALEHVNGQIDSGEFGVTLLHGITDSGKTEVYIRAIERCLRGGKSAIVLLPEIALTTQTVQRFSRRFEKIAVLHSGLTAAQRNVQWQKIKAGEAEVVIGARSAVFAPLGKVGLLVVDEEHESSYKQDTVPRYNGRDVAIKRAQLAGAHCILGSATPSLEMLVNCRRKKHFSMVRLPKRVMDLPLPEMKLVDLRKNFSKEKDINLISGPLEAKLKEALSKKEQAILLLNRRGYSSFIFCHACKHTIHCRNCDVTLTFHKSASQKSGRIKTISGRHINSGHALCHYCGAQTLVREKCPICGGRMAMLGVGSQRLEEELAAKFPDARVARIDSDSMQGKNYYRLLEDFGKGRIDILAGTQMLAKGLHFPNVTVVGIISADTCLNLPDFRSNERTFQLICQVAGRTGRSEKKGTVFVQTFFADQPVMKFALAGDFEGFVEEELKHREACDLPPFWRLAVVILRDTNFEKLEKASAAMRERIDFIVEQYGLRANVRGPVPAVISRIQRYHRMQIVVQAPDAATMVELLKRLRSAGAVRPAVTVMVDVDPLNLL